MGMAVLLLSLLFSNFVACHRKPAPAATVNGPGYTVRRIESVDGVRLKPGDTVYLLIVRRGAIDQEIERFNAGMNAIGCVNNCLPLYDRQLDAFIVFKRQ